MRWRICLLIGCLFSGLGFTVFESANEPAYNGHPLSYWLDQVDLTSSATPTPLQGDAREAVQHIGTNAIPLLLRWMASTNGGLLAGDSVLDAFRILGPSARGAIPELAGLATNQPDRVLFPKGWSNPDMMIGVSSGPLQALGYIGPEALPVLLNILTNSRSPGLRFGAIQAIQSMGPNAAAAKPAMRKCLDDENNFVADFAAQWLRSQSHSPGWRNPALQTLRMHMPRTLACGVLLDEADLGDEGVPRLIRAFYDADVDVQMTALQALIVVAPQQLTNNEVLAFAAKTLHSDNIEKRHWGADVLCVAGQQAEGVAPDIARAGDDWDARMKNATNALRRLAPQWRPGS